MIYRYTIQKKELTGKVVKEVTFNHIKFEEIIRSNKFNAIISNYVDEQIKFLGREKC